MPTPHKQPLHSTLSRVTYVTLHFTASARRPRSSTTVPQRAASAAAPAPAPARRHRRDCPRDVTGRRCRRQRRRRMTACRSPGRQRRPPGAAAAARARRRRRRRRPALTPSAPPRPARRRPWTDGRADGRTREASSPSYPSPGPCSSGGRAQRGVTRQGTRRAVPQM